LNPRIVDQKIERAEFFDHLLYHRLHFFGPRYICFDQDMICAVFFHVLHIIFVHMFPMYFACLFFV